MDLLPVRRLLHGVDEPSRGYDDHCPRIWGGVAIDSRFGKIEQGRLLNEVLALFSLC